jgi:predicted MFS family arabinose efflux permease
LVTASPFRALAHRNFRIFFVGMGVSLIGTWMQGVAQSWLVYRLTHSELMLGTAAFLNHIPTLVLGPIAGSVADRFDRRKIVLATQALFLLQAATLAGLTFTGRISVPWVFVLALMLGLIDAFDRPARQSMLIHLADKDSLLSAISLNSVMFNAARIFGPSLGGVVVAAFGEAVCFTANSVSFLAVIVSLWMLKVQTPVQPDSHPVQHFLEGLRYVRRARTLWPLLALSATVNLAVGPVFTLTPFFADAIFARGSAGAGFLTAAMGIGAIAGTLGLASRTDASGLPGVVRVSVTGLAITALLYAWSPNYAIALLLMTAIGYCLMRQNAATNTLLQTRLDESYRGRVMGVYTTTVIGVLPLGSLAGGALAEAAGPRWTVTISAVLAAIAAYGFRSYR